MYDLAEVARSFDILSAKYKAELDEQFKLGRIKGTEYADVFNQLMDRAMALSYDAPIKAMQLQLSTAQVADQEYVTQNIRPAELAKIKCDTMLCQAKIDDQKYVTQYIRPEELRLAQKNIELRQQEIDLARERIELTKADAALKAAQTQFVGRQIDGFDENKWQKLFEATMNGWGLAFSSGMLEDSPSIVTDESITQLFNKLNTSWGP